MSPEQLQILRHSLGLDQAGNGHAYRNHYVTGEGSTDHPVCMELVEGGFMEKRRPSELTGGDDLFILTAFGKAAAREGGAQ